VEPYGGNGRETLELYEENGEYQFPGTNPQIKQKERQPCH